ncbi:SDR family oxidoreductase [Marilutibacter spongiae]|uniref:SDR family oxidoreductase n=1 Tax=Marilutibacter spongiae TaxID=2025720 RepID=A0A7W3TPH4_9GAMM|nr:SDR family oxidoreductase [Lysobacter spongiae]MBB1062123.1 SDR family oxidoreductase [Lysobacter spongiae]
MKTLRGRTVVITGAGSGFGLEFARLGAREGMKLVLADVQEDALDAVRHELESAGAAVFARVVDVADAGQVEALADAAESRFGPAHLVFNNAGVGTGGLLWENSLADWEWTLGVNLWGVIHGVRTWVPRMLEASRADPGFEAHVVNTASMAGLLNPPLSGVYNVTKHAVVSLTETLHHDLALVTDKVHCSVLCPYYVPTGIGRSGRNRPAAAHGDATRSQRVAEAMVEKAVGSGRVSAADVARTTFESIAARRFYIVSHPQALGGVARRADGIVALREPADPFAARPGQRESLIEALRTP